MLKKEKPPAFEYPLRPHRLCCPFPRRACPLCHRRASSYFSYSTHKLCQEKSIGLLEEQVLSHFSLILLFIPVLFVFFATLLLLVVVILPLPVLFVSVLPPPGPLGQADFGHCQHHCQQQKKSLPRHRRRLLLQCDGMFRK